jgi:hypothetical protein
LTPLDTLLLPPLTVDFDIDEPIEVPLDIDVPELGIPEDMLVPLDVDTLLDVDVLTDTPICGVLYDPEFVDVDVVLEVFE